MTTPVQKYKAGALAATVWKNEVESNGETRAFHTISLEKSYKDKEGKWQQSRNMLSDDLPKAVCVLNKAFEYLQLKTN